MRKIYGTLRIGQSVVMPSGTKHVGEKAKITDVRLWQGRLQVRLEIDGKDKGWWGAGWFTGTNSVLTLGA